ncbi:uncharacterized protein LOC130899703 [Diorhabda carinulata]|uniref:uncharacterized protein LOC130899703 n=1 Tax=Diorhabda carinulata TaxID=1163345 RepID=UPI0025A29F38|nr:uncharacterized protein LOC130899703 [Diorhabda carinulata]
MKDSPLYQRPLLSGSSSESSIEIKSRRNLYRTKKYMRIIEQYDEEELREHFRMKRLTCDYIIDVIRNAKVLSDYKNPEEKKTSKKAVYMTIWYLANTETCRQIADQFDITKSSAHRVISKIVDYLPKK